MFLWLSDVDTNILKGNSLCSRLGGYANINFNSPMSRNSNESCTAHVHFAYLTSRSCLCWLYVVVVVVVECSDNTTYFKCDNGFCLSKSLVCNGVDDCLDRSDELHECGK